MSLPPDAIVAAPAKAAATEDCQTELTTQCIADEAAIVNVSNDDADVLWYVDAEHRRAPKPLLDRLYADVTPDITGLYLPHLARVRFEKNRFSFDPEGQWAVVAPMFEQDQIVNWAAFAVDDDTLRRTFHLGHFAVGLEDAAWNARVRPQRRLLILYSVWEWLRSGCVGVLPVDWTAMAIHILQERYDPLGASKGDCERMLDALECATEFRNVTYRKDAA